MEAGGMLADRYRLVAPIARGAQGTVWRAVDTHGGDVAVKIWGNADVESLLRLVCEQSVRVGDPHVLAPVDWFVRGGEACLVLPLVRGGTLAGLLADYGELPPQAALLMAEQLLGALAAVHAAGLVHRDVKPSNVLLAATGEDRPHVHLADFGVVQCRPHLHLTSPGFVAGTPDYLAPEVRAGEGSTPAQDVYAAGLVLRELGVPADLVATMTADRPEARPSAEAARDEVARARQALGPERWPVVWDDEPFVVPDQFADAPPVLPPVPPPVPDAQPPSAPDAENRPAPDAAVSRAAPARGAGRRRSWAVAAAATAAAALVAVTATVALTADDAGENTGTPPAPTASTHPSPSATRTVPSPAPSHVPSTVPTSAPPTAVPSDAARGLPDPDGPTPFTSCTARQHLAVGFSPEGYALLCTNIPGTRTYEWRPAP